MKEDFLHYVWQLQQFSRNELRTQSGEEISLIKTGEHNTNAGPDFLNAQLRIGEVVWAGSVEIHLRASDWLRHRHQLDAKYDNVILHVVWTDDRPVSRSDASAIPTLELKNRVSPLQLENYLTLLEPKSGIPCSPFFAKVPELTRLSMLDRTLHERLNQKAQEVDALLATLQGDWETTAYRWLVRAYGFKINSVAFSRLSEAMPFSIIRKHQFDQNQLEALLFGQAGFLEEAEDEYCLKLQKEFHYLSHKYSLQEKSMRAADWNFLRLRPANFPTVRLAQLAAALSQTGPIAEMLLQTESIRDWQKILRNEPSEYWQTHFRPGTPSKMRNPTMGLSSVQNLLVNAVAPFLACYARHKAQPAYLERALALLENTEAEKNHITDLYHQLGQHLQSAADSQAMLQLFRNYCTPVRCLQCAIGVKILSSKNG